MNYSLHVLIIGCTLALAWWIRREHHRHAQHLTAILTAILTATRDILNHNRS